MGYQKMNRDGVINLYKELLWLRGSTSCGDVARELAFRGVRTHTGNAPTRQAIHWHMKRGPEEYLLELQPDFMGNGRQDTINEAHMLLDVTNTTNRGHPPHYYTLEYIEAYLRQEGFDERHPELLERLEALEVEPAEVFA